MNRLFDGRLEPVNDVSEAFGDFIPRIDIKDNEDKVQISAELPAMDEDDIDVTISDNRLTIQGEKKEEQEEKDNGYFYKESVCGAFHRVIDLPSEVDEDKATAAFKKGVLKIELPKSAESKTKTKRIQVKAD